MLLASDWFSASGVQAVVLSMAERLITLSWCHALKAITSCMGVPSWWLCHHPKVPALITVPLPLRFSTDYFSISSTTAPDRISLVCEDLLFILSGVLVHYGGCLGGEAQFLVSAAQRSCSHAEQKSGTDLFPAPTDFLLPVKAHFLRVTESFRKVPLDEEQTVQP